MKHWGLIFAAAMIIVGCSNDDQVSTEVGDQTDNLNVSGQLGEPLSVGTAPQSDRVVAMPDGTRYIPNGPGEAQRPMPYPEPGSSSPNNSSSGTYADSDLPLVIFDTDLGPDIDDAVALAMLHGYAKEGKIELAAVTISRNSIVAARFADAINTYYGRPDIPIGIYGGSVSNDNDLTSTLALETQPGNANALKYPHDLTSAPPGYQVHQEVLRRAGNRKVLFIQVGFSGNIAQLLNDQSGIELVRGTDSTLSIMAGNMTRNPEFNIVSDLPSAQTLFAKWPSELVLSDWHVGGHLYYPYERGISNLQGDNPVKAAYERAPSFGVDWHQNAGSSYNMMSWDLTSVLEAIEPEQNYFARKPEAGTVRVDGQGATTFEKGSGSHYLLSDSQNAGDRGQRAMNRMIELVNRPPR